MKNIMKYVKENAEKGAEIDVSLSSEDEKWK